MSIGDEKKVVPASEISDLTRLRERCELATVLNFLKVFETLIPSKVKFTAEEIEMALMEPNKLLSQLHISLLKGIPPVSKTLNQSDAWVTALCKKLSDWWPLVAEGNLPLSPKKGEELSEYKELDPVTRLMALKALCEIRAKQDDAVSYLCNSMKTGVEVSTFRKEMICGDGKGTLYWLDGDSSIGYRLYKEVRKFESGQKVKGKRRLPVINFQWETLATCLEEFRNVAVEFSSSNVKLEVDVRKIIEADVIPVLEKLQKKKERAVKQRQREETLLSGFYNSGLTRTCRSRKAVNYTFDEYDKAISEAIDTQQQSKKRKTTKEQENVKKLGDSKKETGTALEGSTESESDMKLGDDNKDGDYKKEIESASEECPKSDMKSDDDDEASDNEKENETASQESSESDRMSRDGNSSDTETESDMRQDSDINGNSDVEYSDDMNDASSEDGSALNSSDKENHRPVNNKRATYASRQEGSRWSKRVAGIACSPATKLRKEGAKSRLNQRPTINSSRNFVADESEEESSSGDLSDRSSSGNLSDDSDN